MVTLRSLWKQVDADGSGRAPAQQTCFMTERRSGCEVEREEASEAANERRQWAGGIVCRVATLRGSQRAHPHAQQAARHLQGGEQ